MLLEELLTSCGARGNSPGQFQSMTGLAVDTQDKVYAAELLRASSRK
jgi:hypothetical protein